MVHMKSSLISSLGSHRTETNAKTLNIQRIEDIILGAGFHLRLLSIFFDFEGEKIEIELNMKPKMYYETK